MQPGGQGGFQFGRRGDDVGKVDLAQALDVGELEAKTMPGIDSLPAWANMLVGSVSLIPRAHLATVLLVAGATTTVWYASWYSSPTGAPLAVLSRKMRKRGRRLSSVSP